MQKENKNNLNVSIPNDTYNRLKNNEEKYFKLCNKIDKINDKQKHKFKYKYSDYYNGIIALLIILIFSSGLLTFYFAIYDNFIGVISSLMIYCLCVLEIQKTINTFVNKFYKAYFKKVE